MSTLMSNIKLVAVIEVMSEKPDEFVIEAWLATGVQIVTLPDGRLA